MMGETGMPYCAFITPSLSGTARFFVTQEDKEEMVTDTIEELVLLSRMLALLSRWLPILPCLLALQKNQAVSKSPGAMDAQHSAPGSPAIYSPLYPRLVLSPCYQD